MKKKRRKASVHIVEKYTDMRVIDMHRQPKPINLLVLQDGIDWVSLGHFNQFRIEKLARTPGNEASVELSSIYEHNQELSRKVEDTYNQPIYLLQEFSPNQSTQVEDFWALRSAFLLVTRVHAAPMEQQAFEEAIRVCLDEKGTSMGSCSGVHQDDGYRLGKDCMTIMYRTLEFSDIILVAKSDSVQTLMETAGHLYNHPCVGDSYSYIGIAPSELNGEQKHFALKDDVIPCVQMRFAVKNSKEARKYLNSFRSRLPKDLKDVIDDSLFVTGTEDLLFPVKAINSEALCLILYFLLPYIEPCGEKQAQSFWSAFDDMTTRLSIRERDLDLMTGTPELVHDGLYEVYKALYERVRKLYNRVQYSPPDWLRPTMELTKLLLNFSGDCVFHQVCYTVLDGMKGLVRLCEKTIFEDQTAPENQAMIGLLHMTLAGVSDMVEHMIRMEGELVHHPESRPILYDIPANLLELYLHFSESCMSYFMEREKNSSDRRCRMLVVPCLCNTIKLKRIAEYEDVEPALYYVEIPLHLLYDSKYAICSLVHEVSHFSGELCRNRASRFNAFALSLACQMSLHMEMSESPAVWKELVKELKRLIPKDKQAMMDLLQDEAICAVDCIAENEEWIEELLYIFFSSIGQHPDWEERYTRAVKARMNLRRKQNIYKDIEELIYLYRESYSDLSMVLLLELSVEDYLSMLKRDIRITDKNVWPLAIERAAVVILTVKKNWAPEQNCTEEFIKTVGAYIRWFNDHQDGHAFKDAQHCFEAISAVVSYLRQCAKTICKLDNDPANTEMLKRIRKEFVDFADKQKFASSEFYEALELHRQRLLVNKMSNA